MFLIGLLSCQSSNSEPNEHREGTWWFDTTENIMKIYSNDAWIDVSKIIKLDIDSNGDAVTLQDWYDAIHETIQTIQSELCFQSVIVSTGVTLIPIPPTFLSLVVPGSQAFVAVNGVGINPLLTTLESGITPTAVKVPTVLNIGDKISIVIKFISSSRFYPTEQSV